MTAGLRVHHHLPRVHNCIGPGWRAVVWVQGCTLACPGCMVPETWPSAGGCEVDARALAASLLEDPEVEGVTVSGGEPFEQAEGVAALLVAFRAAGRNTWIYTGHTLERLVARADPAVDAVLGLTDVLVDGPYDPAHAAALRLRGSSNQRVLHLTGAIDPDRVARLGRGSVQVAVDEAGVMTVVGIPPPRFLSRLHAGLRRHGVSVVPQAVAAVDGRTGKG